MERISDIRGALLRELAGSETRLSFINTRLILTVGINLNEEERDPRKIAAVREALHKMGFLGAKEGGRGA